MIKKSIIPSSPRTRLVYKGRHKDTDKWMFILVLKEDYNMPLSDMKEQIKEDYNLSYIDFMHYQFG